MKIKSKRPEEVYYNMTAIIKKGSLLLFMASMVFLSSCEKKPAIMTFDKTEHDFGTIMQGNKVTHDFNFTNTGEADLLISNAKGSCGCTVPEYPKEPLKPGESGNIKVSFNSNGKSGQTEKSVTIMVNTKEKHQILKIKANIETPEKAQ